MDDMRNRLLSWCEIDVEALSANLRVFRRLVPPESCLLFVVKSNAYGHGLPLVSRIAPTLGVDWLGVHQLEEAAEVRRAGWKGPVLVMGSVPRAALPDAVDLELDFVVYDLATMEALDRLGRGRPIRCHLKIDTGTHRQGIAEAELETYLARFAASAGLELTGLSMHFANIEDTTDHSYARRQLERFRDALALTRERFPDVLPHAACSAALLVMPETAFALSRVGIGAYGIWPSRETLASHAGRGDDGARLEPVLTWKARVSQVKWVEAGAFIGYGCSHRVTRRTRIAVLPVGYGDGYDRRFSNLAHVLIRGGRAQVLGRICMNIFMVDVTDLPGVEPEEVAVLLGRQEGDEIRATDLAAVAQTIPYEIVSRISPSLPRFGVDRTGRPINS